MLFQTHTKLLCLFFAAILSSGSANTEDFFASGKLEYIGLGYSEELLDEHDEHQFSIDLTLEQSIRDSSQILINARIREDLNANSRDMHRVQEAYWETNTQQWSLKVGRQIFAWGKSDIVNPTDYLAPRSYIDLLDDEDEELGTAALSVRYYHDRWDLETIIAPHYQASLLPSLGDRWFSSLPDEIFVPALAQNLAAQYQFTGVNKPGSSLSNVQYALRFSQQRPGWDYSISYFDGYNDLPYTQTEIIPINTQNVLVQVNQNVNHLRVIGGDFSTTLGENIIRAEAAYFHTKDSGGNNATIDDPYFHYVLGTDFTWDEIFFGEDLFVLLEWSHQIPKTDIDYEINQLDHVFHRSLFIRTSVELENDWILESDFAYDFAGDGVFVNLTGAYPITDNSLIELSLELPLGPTDSFFGSYKDNKALRIRFEFDFDLYPFLE